MALQLEPALDGGARILAGPKINMTKEFIAIRSMVVDGDIN
jgi:hypothetical protein